MLQDQAAAIKNLELPLTEVGEEEEGEQETGHSIWDNVIIVCKKGVSPKDDSEKKSFQVFSNKRLVHFNTLAWLGFFINSVK